MTAPVMAAAGALSDAKLAQEVKELRALLGAQADQLKALNKRVGEAHPETMTAQLAQTLGKLLAKIGVIHSGFTPSASGGGVSASSNVQVKSLGVGTAPSGVTGTFSSSFGYTMDGNGYYPTSDNSKVLGFSNLRWKELDVMRVLPAPAILVHGATPAVDASLGQYFILSVATNIADVVQTPTNPPAAGLTQRITFDIRNTSGGALTTAPAFAAGYKLLSALPALANGQRYTISFVYDQAAALWVQDSAVSPAA